MIHTTRCRAMPVAALVSSLALLACAPLASQPARPAPPPTDPTMNATPPLQAPTLTSQEIAQRMIRLITSLHGIEDISPQAIERQTGIPVKRDPKDPHEYGFQGPIEGPWEYELVAIPDKPGTQARRLRFMFVDYSNSDSTPLGPVCSPSYHEYRDALVAEGFSVKRIWTGRPNDWWRFTRGKVYVTFYMFRGKDPDKEPACVYSYDIRVDPS